MARKQKYNVYQVPKYSTPIPIVKGVTRLQAKRIVKNSREGKNFFVGYLKQSKKKVTNKSSFYY